MYGVMLGSLSALQDGETEVDVVKWFAEKKSKDRTEIAQFEKGKSKPKTFKSLEDLLCDISENDLQSGKKTKFIYSGNDKFPFDAREQMDRLVQPAGFKGRCGAWLRPE